MNYKFTNLNLQKRRKKKRWGRFLLLLFAIFIAVFSLVTFKKSGSTNLISPVGQGNIKVQEASFNSLEEAVSKSLEGVNGKYAVVIKNLKTGESYRINQDDNFESGSLYKLWVMAETYNQIEKGYLKEDLVLSRGIATLNNDFGVSPDVAEQTSGFITLTVNEALHQMITISHNYAALLLAQKIKLSSVKVFLDKYDFKSSSVSSTSDSPKTTASDIALFFEKLYTNKLANAENTQKMLELLKKQTLNHKLPKYLPKGTVIAHKTGEIGWFSHDAGIVYSNGDYVVVVLSESNSPAGAEDRIAMLSKAVFNFFDAKH